MGQRVLKAKPKPYFRDLRDFISLLEETGNLHRIGARIEKNTELMPLVRWQYQGLPDNQRKAFLFDNVTDPQGENYDCSVAVGVLGASFLGTLQDVALDRNLSRTDPAVYQVIVTQPQTKFALTFRPLDNARIAELPQEKRAEVENTIAETKQTTIAKFSILSAIMMICYLGMRFYFKIRGGYRQIELAPTQV